MKQVKLGVVGTGLMGKKHAELIRACNMSRLVGICDVNPDQKSVADALEVPFYQTPEELIGKEQPDGMIIATPNAHHVSVAEACSKHSVHMLIEKPLAETLPQAMRIVDMVDTHGVQVLVGHHRRHSPLIRKSRELVQSGELGNLIGISVLWALMKPEEYFDVEWRREQHVGGPLLINLVHDLDTLRFICGEIRDVYARTTSTVRSFDVEDSLSISISFDNGALGSILASDATPAAWSYEATVGENDQFFNTRENCYHFLGTRASLAFPRMELWRYPDAGRMGWEHEMERAQITVEAADPLKIQMEHFCRVVMGQEEPVMDAGDGVKSLAVALAVQKSASEGVPVDPSTLFSVID